MRGGVLTFQGNECSLSKKKRPTVLRYERGEANEARRGEARASGRVVCYSCGGSTGTSELSTEVNFTSSTEERGTNRRRLNVPLPSPTLATTAQRRDNSFLFRQTSKVTMKRFKLAVRAEDARALQFVTLVSNRSENEDGWYFLGGVLGPSTPTDGTDGDRGHFV